MPALLFGSLSTVADTSELQRAAFNQAFAEHGLDWHWEQADYRSMLSTSGGQDRISTYAESRAEEVDAHAVHATKSRVFQESMEQAQLSPRDGVAETIREAKSNGLQVALVTTTSAENIAALMQALPDIAATDFDLVLDAASVEQPKPAGDAYALALSRLGVRAADSVAIEDNVGGVQAAVAGGVVCVAFPNVNTGGHDFASAKALVQRLDFAELRSLIPNA